MQGKVILTVIGLSAVAGAGVPAMAGTTQYFDRTSFESALPSFTVTDFDTDQAFPLAPAPVVSFLGTVQSSSVGGPAFLYDYAAGNQALEGSSNPASPVGDAFQAITLTFTTPLYAVGFDDLDLTANDEVAWLVVHFAGGQPDQSFTRTDSVGFSNPFLGVISTDAISSVDIFSADPNVTTPGGRANLIDNLTLGSVPAPASFLAISGGAILLTGRRRVNRK